MNLLFSIDEKCVSLLLDCLHSITDRGGAERYDAYILHSNLTEADMERIAAHAPHSVACCFVPVPADLFNGFPTSKRYPLQIYYRLAAPLLLPEELDRVLYLDVDTVVINSLVPLYESDFEGNLFMACTHTQELLSKANRVRLGIEKDVPYINTGVMMMNLRLLRKDLDIGAIQAYALTYEQVLILPDQDILTALYGDRVKLLDTMIYNLSDRTLAQHNADLRNPKRDLDWVRENTVVIHYFGRNKPWKNPYLGVLDVFYREVKARWESGTP